MVVFFWFRRYSCVFIVLYPRRCSRKRDVNRRCGTISKDSISVNLVLRKLTIFFRKFFLISNLANSQTLQLRAESYSRKVFQTLSFSGFLLSLFSPFGQYLFQELFLSVHFAAVLPSQIILIFCWHFFLAPTPFHPESHCISLRHIPSSVCRTSATLSSSTCLFLDKSNEILACKR